MTSKGRRNEALPELTAINPVRIWPTAPEVVFAAIGVDVEDSLTLRK